MPDQENNIDQKQSFFAEILSLPNDSTKKTIVVAGMLCLVCSILVSASAVILKPLQISNKKADIKRNILAVANLKADGENLEELFKQFEMKVVDLETGEYANDIDPAGFDQRKAASDPSLSINISGDQDIAGIGHRSKFAKVYLLKEGNQTKQIVLPVHGYGLWSTLYGFLSLESDANTIKGLKFYEHAETPGLGGEVDNPKWQSQWVGKKIFDDNGDLRFEIVRGKVVSGASSADYQVDGLSGATLTSKGVSNMVNFWLGKDGFGPYLNKLNPKEKG